MILAFYPLFTFGTNGCSPLKIVALLSKQIEIFFDKSIKNLK